MICRITDFFAGHKSSTASPDSWEAVCRKLKVAEQIQNYRRERMKISTKGRYALRLMLDLAQHGGDDFISLKDIAQRQEISVKYLEQIVTVLCRIGFLKSLRGSQGGYKLAKSPEQYTVGDILRTTEGNLAPVSCLKDKPNKCARYEKCGTVNFWEGLYDTVNRYVDSVTLADLASNAKRI